MDDDKDWHSVVRTWLEEHGYMVLTAKDGTEAITKAGKTRFDLFILDLDLAGESGLMLMKFLNENHPDVPIILYSGKVHDEKEVQAMRDHGASHYLAKGKKEELVNTIGEIFKERPHRERASQAQ